MSKGIDNEYEKIKISLLSFPESVGATIKNTERGLVSIVRIYQSFQK